MNIHPVDEFLEAPFSIDPKAQVECDNCGELVELGDAEYLADYTFCDEWCKQQFRTKMDYDL